MLINLNITNFALIDRVELEFGHGLNVISGETGAGKSILMKAIGFLLGARAKIEYLRDGADAAVVEAHFELSDESLVFERLIEAGLQADGELIIRRQLNRQGRSRCWINGSMVTTQMLNQITRHLVDISGQHEHYSLLRSDQHLRLLDRVCQLTQLSKDVENTYANLAAIDARVKELLEQRRVRTEQEAFLNFQLTELNEANLVEPSEEEMLEMELSRLKNLDELHLNANELTQSLYHQDNSAIDLVSRAIRSAELMSDFDQSLNESIEHLHSAHALLDDVRRSVERFADTLEAEPDRIEAIEARLAQLNALKRKYGYTLADVIAHRDQLSAQVQNLANSDLQLDEAKAERTSVEKSLRDLCTQLSAARRRGGESFKNSVEAEFQELGLEGATLILNFVALSSGLACHDIHVGPQGAEHELLISTNPGEAAGPLNRIVSGGELSRIMLAMKQVIANQDNVAVYIFDEVDAGVGGETAEKVGQKLASVAKIRQAFCVTHLPQVAAYATAHYTVEKVSKRAEHTRIHGV